MASARDTGIELMNRLLAGERGRVPLVLAMLLEKSSSLADSDENYRQLGLPELVGLQLSPEAVDEIVSTICAQALRDPDAGLIAAISFVGSDLPTKTAVRILTNPPRPLTLPETCGTLSLLMKTLPYYLRQDAEYLPRLELDHLVHLAKEFRILEDGETDKSWRFEIRLHAEQLLEGLGRFGIF